MRIVVTGSNGKLGRPTVELLRAEGHDVLGLDIAGPIGPGSTRVDLGDLGQVLDAFHGVTGRIDRFDALVHLAAIPMNGLVPDAATFQQNVTATFHVLHAARRVGIRTIVHASSITAQGYPFADARSLPIDETRTEATTTYGLSKVAEEAICAQMAAWDAETSITSLRFANVVAAGEYAAFDRPGDLSYRRALAGTYVDARDGARAVALALAAATPGHDVLTIAAGDSSSTVPTRALAAEWFPGVPVADDLAEFAPLLSIAKAERVLGFRPRHHWRDELALEQQA